jgi:hypothetical protein
MAINHRRERFNLINKEWVNLISLVYRYKIMDIDDLVIKYAKIIVVFNIRLTSKQHIL